MYMYMYACMYVCQPFRPSQHHVDMPGTARRPDPAISHDSMPLSLFSGPCPSECRRCSRPLSTGSPRPSLSTRRWELKLEKGATILSVLRVIVAFGLLKRQGCYTHKQLKLQADLKPRSSHSGSLGDLGKPSGRAPCGFHCWRQLPRTDLKKPPEAFQRCQEPNWLPRKL